jgi:hypothetical protein
MNAIIGAPRDIGKVARVYSASLILEQGAFVIPDLPEAERNFKVTGFSGVAQPFSGVVQLYVSVPSSSAIAPSLSFQVYIAAP